MTIYHYIMYLSCKCIPTKYHHCTALIEYLCILSSLIYTFYFLISLKQFFWLSTLTGDSYFICLYNRQLNIGMRNFFLMSTQCLSFWYIHIMNEVIEG